MLCPTTLVSVGHNIDRCVRFSSETSSNVHVGRRPLTLYHYSSVLINPELKKPHPRRYILSTYQYYAPPQAIVGQGGGLSNENINCWETLNSNSLEVGDYWGVYTYSLTMQSEVIKCPTIETLSSVKPLYNPHQVRISWFIHSTCKSKSTLPIHTVHQIEKYTIVG